MADSPLLASIDDGIARLSLNRPSRKNALDRELVHLLGEKLEEVTKNEDVRVVVLGGEGGSFCSGADLASMSPDQIQASNLDQRLEEFHRMIRAIVGAPQPVVASIEGPAVGFGADLALACDLRIMSRTGYVQESFSHIGLMPDGGGTFTLASLIGPGRALEYLLLGTKLDAERCEALGIANRVVSPEALEAATSDLARTLADRAPLAVAAIKAAVRGSSRDALNAALERERNGQLSLLRSSDFTEGVMAFLQKRRPRFTGR